MTESTKLYKILGLNAEPINGGSRTWNTNGKWMPFIEDIEPCERGYHLCKAEYILDWLGPVIWEAAYKGELIEDEDKVVVQQARIIRRTAWNLDKAVKFANDCADRAEAYARDAASDARYACAGLVVC